MDAAKLRAWWFHRQGLDGSLTGKSAADVLEKAGWSRSVGGAGPYLTLFSRGGMRREAVDAAVSELQIHELPAARGCTYVVPESHFALALKVGQGFADENQMQGARKLGVTDSEIDKLCTAVVNALDHGPMDTGELRDAAGGTVRNLGEEGKKKGLTSTLPVALLKLQSAGEIRRISTNGRLDQQRYRYARWRPNPLAKFTLSAEEAYIELARCYFTWIGPASLNEFQWFSGLGVKASRAAVAPLGLVAVEEGDQRLMFPRDREEFGIFRVPKQPRYVLIGSLDGISNLRRAVRELLADEDLKQSVFAEKGFQPVGGVSDLPSHAILDRGRLMGLWEFDVAGNSIAWTSFSPLDKALRKAVDQMEAYVRSDLGDARSFSLDSPKSRIPRINALRQAGKPI